MESILFKGDDSSSGESDTEPQTSTGSTQPKSSGTTSRHVPNTGVPPRADVSTGPMSQSEMAQRLKSMYSPASKAGTSSTGTAQSAVPSHQATSVQQNLAAPVLTQQVPQHRPPQQQNVQNTASNYRPNSAGESAQLQQRGSIQQPNQRSGIQPLLQQRPGGGVPHQQQIAPLVSNVQHPSEQQQSRPRMHQMQAPSIPHRPSNRLPHQQQSVRHAQQSQPQGNVPPIRNPTPSAPAQSVTQMPAPRSNSYSTAVAQQQQQVPQASTVDRVVMEKKQKERFLVFTRVLMKYLETKDPPLHSKVKAIIKDCADRNRRKEVGFESVTAAMRIQLRKVVSDVYWKKAEDYLKHFLKEKAAKPGMLPNASGSYNSGSSSIPAVNSAGGSQETVKRSNELQMQSQQRQPDTTRVSNLDQGKGSLPITRDDQGKKRQVVASAVAPTKSVSQAKSVPSFQAGKEKSAPKSRAKGASTPTQQRKQSLSTVVTNADVAVTVPVALAKAVTPALVPVVREYNELMEQVDHAYSFDGSATGSLLGESIRTTMTEEQIRLLYESKKFSDLSRKDFGSEAVSFPVQGWSKRNIISSRVAWSRLRAERQFNTSVSTSTNPLVAGGLLGLTQVPGKKPVTIEGGSNPENSEVDFDWYNEEKAETDVALAVLSEGAEIYLKAVVMKALHCARQRQNLDGIRLWHQQFARDEAKPSLSLMLGCDVVRQVAQSDGNAAMTCMRLEEANKRQSNIPARSRILNDLTLTHAKSMSDLSLRPKLEKAETAAELEGKRKFEIYGGKLHEEPPLGRLVKVAKLEVSDFQTGMALSRRGRRHQAATFSSSFFY